MELSLPSLLITQKSLTVLKIWEDFQE